MLTSLDISEGIYIESTLSFDSDSSQEVDYSLSILSMTASPASPFIPSTAYTTSLNESRVSGKSIVWCTFFVFLPPCLLFHNPVELLLDVTYGIHLAQGRRSSILTVASLFIRVCVYICVKERD